jgi:hypothetical protein
MKKTIAAIVLLAGAVSGYAQGQINMNDYSDPAFSIQIFNASQPSDVTVTYGGYTGFEVQGNTVNDLNPGSTYYIGGPLGFGYSICLLAGAAGDSLAQLVPVAGTTFSSWISAGGGGYWYAPANLATIPGITTVATLAIAAWNNEGGAVTSLGVAQATPGDAWGFSALATEAVGYGTVPPPNLPAGITSFSLASATPEPEPSTIALVVIGASAFLMRLRRGADL